MRGLAVMLCLLVTGCGTASVPESTQTAGPASPHGASSPSSTESTATVIIAADSKFGTILYDASGQPIYLFDAETSSTPECYGECAQAWPPVLTTGMPRGQGSVRSDLLGTTRRSDGATQVTYAGHPLYFYAHEGKYQVLCHNVVGFGGTWLVVQPNGKPAAS